MSDDDDFDIEGFDDEDIDNSGESQAQQHVGDGSLLAGTTNNNINDPSRGGLAVQIDSADAPPEVDVKAMFPNSTDMALPRITNTICSASIGKPIDLLKLAQGVCFIEYNPQRRTGKAAILRIRDPACSCTIRQDGSLVVNGAYDVQAAKRAAMLTARIIVKVLDIKNLTEIKFEVKSLTARFDLGHKINIEKLGSENTNFATLQKTESVYSCILKLQGSVANPWKVTATIFPSGKIHLSGTTPQAVHHIQWAYNKLLPLLVPCTEGAQVVVVSSTNLPSTREANNDDLHDQAGAKRAPAAGGGQIQKRANTTDTTTGGGGGGGHFSLDSASPVTSFVPQLAAPVESKEQAYHETTAGEEEDDDDLFNGDGDAAVLVEGDEDSDFDLDF